MRSHAPLVLWVGCLLTADVPERDRVRDEEKSLGGTWVVESLVRDPRGDGVPEVKGLKVVIKGQMVVVKLPVQEEVDRGLIMKVDPTKEPKALDLWVDETIFGKSRQAIFKEPPVLGIYELHGDTLRVCCVPLERRERPTKFTAKAGSGQILLVLKRVVDRPDARTRQAD